MILDIILIVLAIVFLIIGFKVGFLQTFIKMASLLSGLIIAILCTKPVANFAIDHGAANGMSNNVYQNIVESSAFEKFSAAGGGTDGISALLTDLGLPEFISDVVSQTVLKNADPLGIAREISDSISELVIVAVTFILLLIFSSLLFVILRLIIKALRKSIGLVKVLDGIIGAIFFLLVWLFLTYIMLLILSFVLQSIPASNGFASWISGQLHLTDDKFGLTKYLYENNFIGNLLKIFM